MSDSASIQVAVRVRPLNERELKHNTLPVLSASSEKNEVTLIKTTGGTTARQQRTVYNFDAVFSDYSTQRDVFEKVRPLVDDVLCGYEGTVSAGYVQEHAACVRRDPYTLLSAAGPTCSRHKLTRPTLPAPPRTGLRVRPDRHGKDAHDGGQPGD